MFSLRMSKATTFILTVVCRITLQATADFNITVDESNTNDELEIGNFITDFGGKVKIPGNLLIDQILENAQKTLTNFTRVYIPNFKYSNMLASVAVKNSYFEGLHSFHRVGPVVMDVHPLGKNGVEFGVGWTDITAVFNVEFYPFQFGFSVIPDKGTLTIKLSNVTSVQAVAIEPLKMTLEITKFELSLGSAAVGFEGFSPTASLISKMLTAFINENKDQFLEVLSFVLKTLFNACVIGVKGLIFP